MYSNYTYGGKRCCFVECGPNWLAGRVLKHRRQRFVVIFINAQIHERFRRNWHCKKTWNNNNITNFLRRTLIVMPDSTCTEQMWFTDALEIINFLS